MELLKIELYCYSVNKTFRYTNDIPKSACSASYGEL